jgi:hypothetical protein
MSDAIIDNVKQWLKDVVIGIQLCPFAKAPFQKNKIRFFVSKATTEEQLIEDLIKECGRLDSSPDIETTLLICPTLLYDFFMYSQFLLWAEKTLKQQGWEGTYQIASFHPDYEFAGTEKSDPQNLTNRSPYPILHLLREERLSKILDRYDSPEDIPQKNIETVNKLSQEKIKKLFPYLFKNHV